MKKAIPISFYAAVCILLIFAFRTFLTARFPIEGDEAYYWLWAKHLALGYHDHPPLAGWLIALSTLVSNGTFWVRFPALACSFLSAFFFYLTAEAILNDRTKALTALLFFLLAPVFAVTSLAVVPDMSLILSWTIALWAGWKAQSNARYWLIAGAAVGTAIMSKLIGLFLIPSFAVFFMIDPKSRRGLRSRFFWGAVLLAVLISSPFWFWNFTHGFENFTFQMHDHLGGAPPSPILSFLGYCGVQALNVSPVLFLIMIPAVIGLIRKSEKGDERASYLLAFAVPIHALFFILPFFARVGFHWALVGYCSLFIATADRADFKKGIRVGLSIAMAMTFLFYAVLAFPDKITVMLSPLAGRYPSIKSFFVGKGYGELLGYEDLSKIVKQEAPAAREENPFLLTGSYTLSSDLWYNTGIPVRTALFSGQGGMYSRWNHFETLKGRNALWVDLVPFSEEPEVSLVLSNSFRRIGETRIVEVRQGAVTRSFYLTMLYDLRNPSALPSASDPVAAASR